MRTCIIRLLAVSVFLFLHWACNDDETIIDPTSPSVEFSTENGEYNVKLGNWVEISATVRDAVDPVYSWREDGKIISTESSFAYYGQVLGEHFVTLRVDAANGWVEGQVKVNVLKSLAPDILLDDAALAFAGMDLEIVAELSFDDETVTYQWILDNSVVGTGKSYTFRQDEVGVYTLILKVTSHNGQNTHIMTITVLPPPEPELYFDDGKFRTETGAIPRLSVCLGRSLVLAPVKVMIDQTARFQWKVDGVQQSETSEYFSFTPAAKGTYTVTVTTTQDGKQAEGTVEVECVDAEGTYYRPYLSGTHQARATEVFEYSPAPGQFVSVPTGATAETLRAETQLKLESSGTGYFTSLGAYGGYVVIGFDHSIPNIEGLPDLIIEGNPFDSSNEPGIVYVMQDENGDGLPNDTWYELKGSETGTAECWQRYAVTYFRPGSQILYMDSKGETGTMPGTIDRFLNFIDGDRLTFVGTRLPSKFEIINGTHYHGSFDWGYVDNLNDREGFYIEDAIQADGSPANLEYIDFIKVQTGQLVYSSLLGEVSTELCAPIDYHNR
ncbi:MAG: hypothetical protein LIO77_01445 [Rikenellaceae bacterium]|nr:hypothetical protein [Rikenellaceae bacterium]